jgi:hypothetical protein
VTVTPGTPHQIGVVRYCLVQPEHSGRSIRQ